MKFSQRFRFKVNSHFFAPNRNYKLMTKGKKVCILSIIEWENFLHRMCISNSKSNSQIEVFISLCSLYGLAAYKLQSSPCKIGVSL